MQFLIRVLAPERNEKVKDAFVDKRVAPNPTQKDSVPRLVKHLVLESKFELGRNDFDQCQPAPL